MALQCSSWSDLPLEILELIFDCLKDPIDILRCGAACRSWLQTALQAYPKCLLQCFILTGKVKDGAPVLFNLLTNETRKIQVPETKEKLICAYSNSWLVLVDSKYPYMIQLLNVFSRTQIDLPSFTSGPLQPIEFDPTNNGWKLLLSKSPLDSDCTVFLLRDLWFIGKISSWKPGERKWTNLNTTFSQPYGAILYKGKLYATISDSTSSHILITCNYKLEVEAKVLIPETFKKYHGHFLAKSLNDNCLLVGDSILGAYRFGESIEIFEFDVCTKQFREVNDLGGCALFLGRDNFLAEARHSETWFKANFIYFFRHSIRDYFVYDFKTRDFTISPLRLFTKDGVKY